MEKIIINPSILEGQIIVPPSKSMAHRAVIAASLSKGESIIDNIDLSEDITATIGAMKALGTEIEISDNSLKINGNNLFRNKKAKIDCNESGSTLRFLIPISLVNENSINFKGRGNLGKRPLDTYYNIFEGQGIEYKFKKGELDLKLKGKLKSGEFSVRGDISSQFISGLLFALPLLQGESKILITTELESKGYIDLTINMMNRFGIKIINKNYREFIINGNQKYISTNYKVEGDYSQGAFYLAAGAVGNKVNVLGLDEASLQGDREMLNILKDMNCSIDNKNGLRVIENNLRGTIIDGAQCPDVIPVLTVVAALSKGESRIINAGRLRIKECDRLTAICSELNKIGAKITEFNDGLVINGVNEFIGGEVDSWNDHRIAMSLAIASTRCKNPLVIKNPMCVKKSYPLFWEDFKKLGGDIGGWNMGK